METQPTISENMPVSPIKSITITGLFGIHDVHLEFKNPYKILIGANGLGKTHILNIINDALSANYLDLILQPFETLTIELTNGAKETIKRLDIIDFFFTTTGITDSEKNDLPEEAKKEVYNFLLETINSYNYIEDYPDFKYHYLQRTLGLSGLIYLLLDINGIIDTQADKLLSHLRESNLSEKVTIQIQSHLNQFHSNIIIPIKKYENVFLPTYRRVETIPSKLFKGDTSTISKDNSIIQFSMADVEHKLQKITSIISTKIRENFPKITGEIMGLLAEAPPPVKKDFFNESSREKIETILNRLGNQLDRTKKDKIILFLANDTMTEINGYLAALLNMLLEIFDEYKKWDDVIISFTKVCNGYLTNKQIVYDPNALEVYVELTATHRRLAWGQLSSGEKQLVSIFAKIYLITPEEDKEMESKKFIIIIDEPELSLNIFWQKTFLPDIIKSGQCALLLTATHSPFIFDNELDAYATDLFEYMTPTQKTEAQPAI